MEGVIDIRMDERQMRLIERSELFVADDADDEADDGTAD